MSFFSGYDLSGLLWAQIWQVSLLVIVVAGLHYWFARNRPHLAHALWVLVLIKCVAPPVVGSPISPFSWVVPRMGEQSVKVDANPLVGGDTRRCRSKPAGSNMALDRIVVHAVPVLEVTDRRGEGSVDGSGGGTRESGFGDLAVVKPRNSSWNFLSISSILLVIWMVGVLIHAGITWVRWCKFKRWLHTHETVDSPYTMSVIRRLTTQLGIRRTVRLQVVSCQVGPAVTGVIRPTILLPKVMVSARSELELEPLLAHELVHVRRGDLWWSLLQTVSKSVFWFHPMVWWACSMVTWESERSCDEETIASLGCSPRRYAKCLIDVLELKHRLRVAPAVPGVRPVDITSARLERVMKLGNGCHCRTPVWVWTILFLACCVVLPGASFAWSQQEAGADVGENGISKKIPSPRLLPLLDGSDQELATSRVSGVAEQFLGTTVPASRQEREIGWLLEIVKGREFSGTSAENAILKQFQNVERLHGLHIKGNTLVFFAKPDVTELVDDLLSRWKTYGIDSIALETVFLSIKRDQLQRVELDWRFGGDPIVAINDTGKERLEIDSTRTDGYCQVEAKATTSGDQIALVSLATNQEISEMIKLLLGEESTTLHSSPMVIACSGQEAMIEAGSEHSFVVGARQSEKNIPAAEDELQPIVDFVHEGTAIKQVPVIDPLNGTVRLVLDINVATILEVDTVEMPWSGGLKLQQPKIERSRIQSDITIPSDKDGAVICYFGKDDDGADIAELIVIKSRVIPFWDGDVDRARQMPVGEEAPVDSPMESSGEVQRSSDQRELLNLWMEKFQLRLEFQTEVEFELSEDGNEGVIRGKELRISSVDQDRLSFSGGDGTLRFSICDQDAFQLEFKFQSGVEAVFDGARISASSGNVKIVGEPDGEKHYWEFTDVRMSRENVELEANSLVYEQQGDFESRFEIEGNCKIHGRPTGQEEIQIDGDRIVWDVMKNQIESAVRYAGPSILGPTTKK